MRWQEKGSDPVLVEQLPNIITCMAQAVIHDQDCSAMVLCQVPLRVHERYEHLGDVFRETLRRDKPLWRMSVSHLVHCVFSGEKFGLDVRPRKHDEWLQLVSVCCYHSEESGTLFAA